MATLDDEDRLLRSVALQNANSIALARQRAEEELLRTKEALRESEARLEAALGAAGTGTFRPVSPVVFVVLAEGAAECTALQEAVRTGPAARELEQEAERHENDAIDLTAPAKTPASSTRSRR